MEPVVPARQKLFRQSFRDHLVAESTSGPAAENEEKRKFHRQTSAIQPIIGDEDTPVLLSQTKKQFNSSKRQSILIQPIVQEEDAKHRPILIPSKPENSVRMLERSSSVLNRKQSARSTSSNNLISSEPSTNNNKRLWGKVKNVGKLAYALGQVNKEHQEFRKERVQARWNMVRQIARAAMSINVLEYRRDIADTKNGILNYTKFCSIMGMHPSQRTSKDLDFLVKSTEDLSFFSKLLREEQVTIEQHREICRTMVMRQFAAHETVFNQGDLGDNYYILVEGSASVNKTGNGSISKVVARLKAGDGFGEIALVQNNCVRTAGIVTSEKCTMLKIHKEDYQRILAQAHQEEFENRIQFLHRVRAFEKLTNEDVFNLATGLKLHIARPGTIINSESASNDQLNYFLIVKRGELEVHKAVTLDDRAKKGQIDESQKSKFKNNLRMCLLGPTEAICDWETLGTIKECVNYKYPFSVRANTLVEYYAISKHDLLGKVNINGILAIKSAVTHFPDARSARNAFAVSVSWQQYKKGLVDSIVGKGPVKVASKNIIQLESKKKTTIKKSCFERNQQVQDFQLYSDRFQSSSCHEAQQVLTTHTNIECTIQMRSATEYSKVADEMQDFLKDSFALNRHIYENPLTDGARFFARALEYM